MTYKVLAPSEKPPFPFIKDTNGAYPIGAFPTGVLSFDQAMQAYYIAVLTAAQKIDPGATISDNIGMVVLTMPDGKNLMLTGGLWNEYNLKIATAEAQLARVGIAPPPPPAPPTPPPKPIRVYGVATKDTLTGKWFKWVEWPFGDDWQQACDPPANAPAETASSILQAQIVKNIRDRLKADPPKPQAVVDELISIASYVAALPV